MLPWEKSPRKARIDELDQLRIESSAGTLVVSTDAGHRGFDARYAFERRRLERRSNFAAGRRSKLLSPGWGDLARRRKPQSDRCGNPL
jgi:hypothetical protein